MDACRQTPCVLFADLSIVLLSLRALVFFVALHSFSIPSMSWSPFWYTFSALALLCFDLQPLSWRPPTRISKRAEVPADISEWTAFKITNLNGVVSAAVDRANAKGGPQVVFANYGADCNGHRFRDMASVDRRRIVTIRGSTICQSTIRAILAPTAQLFLMPLSV